MPLLREPNQKKQFWLAENCDTIKTGIVFRTLQSEFTWVNLALTPAMKDVYGSPLNPALVAATLHALATPPNLDQVTWPNRAWCSSDPDPHAAAESTFLTTKARAFKSTSMALAQVVNSELFVIILKSRWSEKTGLGEKIICEVCTNHFENILPLGPFGVISQKNNSRVYQLWNDQNKKQVTANRVLTRVPPTGALQCVSVVSHICAVCPRPGRMWEPKLVQVIPPESIQNIPGCRWLVSGNLVLGFEGCHLLCLERWRLNFWHHYWCTIGPLENNTYSEVNVEFEIKRCTLYINSKSQANKWIHMMLFFGFRLKFLGQWTKSFLGLKLWHLSFPNL